MTNTFAGPIALRAKSDAYDDALAALGELEHRLPHSATIGWLIRHRYLVPADGEHARVLLGVDFGGEDGSEGGDQ